MKEHGGRVQRVWVCHGVVTNGPHHLPEPFHSVTVEFEKLGAISKEISRFEYEARLFVLLFFVSLAVGGGVRFILGVVAVAVLRLRNDFRRPRFAESGENRKSKYLMFS